VTLVGEAHFDVDVSSGTPFVVRTGHIVTRVLGTSFTVRHYAADPHVQVAVIAGKVAVTTRAHPGLTLTAGGVGIMTDSTAVLASSDSTRSYTVWTGGHLVFREAPTREVLTTLSQWYGYQFQLADSILAHRRLTATLDAESSANALSTIKLLLNVDLTFDGNVITLHPRSQQHPQAHRRNGGAGELTPHAEVGR